jgi:hypothetical protein
MIPMLFVCPEAVWIHADNSFAQGYEADNPNIELLRLRNFTLGKGIEDEIVTGKQGLETILELIGALVPFVSPPLCLQFVSLQDLQDAITSNHEVLDECGRLSGFLDPPSRRHAPFSHPKLGQQ